MNRPDAEFAISTCAGKQAFDTFALANQVARRFHRGQGSAGRRAYHCTLCGKFHVGTSIKPKVTLKKPRVT